MKRVVFALVVLCLLLTGGAYAQTGRVQRVQNLYDSLKVYKIESPETVLAIAILETGWMECKNCTNDYNNLFGFHNGNRYMRFANVSACLEYMRKWQDTYYMKWKGKRTYHEFLVYMKYARDMPSYLKKIRWLEKWIKENVK